MEWMVWLGLFSPADEPILLTVAFCTPLLSSARMLGFRSGVSRGKKSEKSIHEETEFCCYGMINTMIPCVRREGPVSSHLEHVESISFAYVFLK